MSPRNNLQALENAIMSEAQREARQILEKANRQAQKIEQQAKEEVEAQCTDIVQQAHEKAKELRDQAIATAQLEAQTLRLQRREHLLNNIFNSAQQKLQDEIPQRSDYEDILRALIQQALAHLNADEVRIHADDTTKQFLDAGTLDTLSQTLGARLHNGDILSHGTGIVLETLNGHRRYDNTLETRLARMKESLRTEIYHILRGEKR